MYFPIGWPKVLKVFKRNIIQITCDRDKILFAILSDESLEIWFCKPCVPIVYHKRSQESLKKFGTNVTVQWKPDSSKIVIATSEGHLLFYKLNVLSGQKGLYVQNDSPYINLRRDSAELFIKETIPSLSLDLENEVTVWDGGISGIVCITMAEIMLSTSQGHVLRYQWDGLQIRDYTLDLRRIPFCINQQVSRAVPIIEENIFIIDIEYSPLVGGFSIVLNDGRAAFLTASSLKFDPNQVQGIWAQGIEDAICTTINHKYRLITFGRANSECIVYYVDESTGALEISHTCFLSSKDYSETPGHVKKVLWTPDGCALVASWQFGGIAMWSTFGALLMCSLGWDYGLKIDIHKNNPLQIISMEFATEGYQLWMIHKPNETSLQDNQTNSTGSTSTTLFQMDFLKSALTANPCVSHQSHLYLQGDDKLYINFADTLVKFFSECNGKDEVTLFGDININSLTTILAEGKQWVVLPIPSTYCSTNWPIRYSSIDSEGQNVAVAGRLGLAHYSMQTRRWKLFGNETQEKDFIVTGGLLWWRDYLIVGCYSILENTDELRFYSRDFKLDNKFAKIIKCSAPILLLNILHDQLISLGSDALINIWNLQQSDNVGEIQVIKIQTIDISAMAVHSACITSITLTSLRTETSRKQVHKAESVVLNISGRLIMVQREIKSGDNYTCLMPTVLASCVENVWVPDKIRPDKVHLTEALWLFCGAHGMRVWLPLYPRNGNKSHTFMSKRIMLPFHIRIYPLAILFEDAIIMGAENDTITYTSDTNSPFSLPFSVLQRTSQVYLHHILRQLIRRNLGYHAWEIARSCTNLPYFPHSLELLLHEVLEEEATTKEPIPDAQLPSVIEFIMEFPVYLQTVVQCARKTEIALWPYLFSVAGKPKDLFQECMAKQLLDTAASYLIILQNLETCSVSRQYATLLLNTALAQSKWDLAKDLVRFLRAIDPNAEESPRTSFILPSKLVLSPQTQPGTPNADDISLILGNVQGPRVRSFSTTVSPKLNDRVNESKLSTKSPNLNRKRSTMTSAGTIKESVSKNASNHTEEFFMDIILQKHARQLLASHRLRDLGYFAAHLDFHLVTWLGKERDHAARIDDFIKALKMLHDDFTWPYPTNLLKNELPSPQCTEDINKLEDHLKTLKVDVCSYLPGAGSKVGDSGYMSFPGIGSGIISSLTTLENSQVTYSDFDENIDVNKFKFPVSDIKASQFIDESTMSTVSSAWADETKDFYIRKPQITDNNWQFPSTYVLEQLNANGNKGSHRAEIQLRYLLQLFMEAGCLEWSMLISIILQDALAVIRTVNAAKSIDQSAESVSRLRQGFLLLNYWTNRECLGYRTFMVAIQNQIFVLNTILENKLKQQIVDQKNFNLSNFSSLPTFSRHEKIKQGSILHTEERITNNPNFSEKSVSEKVNINYSNTKLTKSEEEDPYLPESTGCTLS